MDYHPAKDKKIQLDDFDNSIALAFKNKIKVAYSNDAFELWFVLHDKYLIASWSRHECFEQLTNKFKVNYQKEGKTKAFVQKLHSHYSSNQPIAITNAKKLHKEKQNLSPSVQCPCTTVYLLVEELNKSLKI